MKKVFLFISLFTALFISCSDDDSDNNPPIVGQWGYVSFTDIETGEVEPGDVCDVQDVVTFKADMTFISRVFSDDGNKNEDGSVKCEEEQYNGTYSIDGDKISIVNKTDSDLNDTYTFKIDGSNLSIITSDGTSLYRRK